MSGYHDTYGGLVIDRDRCAYCEAWPDLPCALHRDQPDPRCNPTPATETRESAGSETP